MCSEAVFASTGITRPAKMQPDKDRVFYGSVMKLSTALRNDPAIGSEALERKAFLENDFQLA
jgi:hypothetical protein